MFLPLHVLEFLKDMMVRFPKPYSILKEPKFYRLGSTRPLEFGMRKHSNACKFCKATRMKFSLANSTTKEIPLLQALKIIPVKYGEINKLGKSE
jgi:hypothetical protein